MGDFDTIVIGSGAGGLAAAVALARAGEKVLVLEQHYLPGGWCHSFTLEDYRFSPGVHYIGETGPGGRMRDLYERLGVSSDLSFIELSPNGFDHFMVGDDQRFDVPAGKDKYEERLVQRFPGERKGIEALFRKVTAIDGALRHPVQLRANAKDLWTEAKRMKDLAVWGMRSWQALLDAHVSDALLQGYLSMVVGNHGTPAERVPAALHSGVMAHYFDGGAYPQGGGSAIPRAFIRELGLHGGAIRVRTPVKKILIESRAGRHCAVGVELAGGEQLHWDNVISNADPAITYGQLISAEHLPSGLVRKLRKTRYSTPLMMAFLATDMDLGSMGYDSGNYWYASSCDVSSGFRNAAHGGALPNGGSPNAFLTITTMKDRSKFDGKHHTLEVFAPVAWEEFQRWEATSMGSRPQSYERHKQAILERMLRSAEKIMPGLSQHLVFSDIGSPLTNAHYVAAPFGSAYGVEKILGNIGPFGYGLRSPIANLHLCGASTEGGHGVLGGTMGGVAAAAAQRGVSVDRLLSLSPRGEPLTLLPSGAGTTRAPKAARRSRAGAPRHAQL